MIVYAESSAVLAWLVGEPSGEAVRQTLIGAERVVSSSLTSVECARGLARARLAARLQPGEELAALRLLDVAQSTWDVLHVSDRVLARARARFPVEPLRTLDALHLATAAVFHEAFGRVAVLTLDRRIIDNAMQLGFEIAAAS